MHACSLNYAEWRLAEEAVVVRVRVLRHGPAHQLCDLHHAVGWLGSRQRRLATACGMVCVRHVSLWQLHGLRLVCGRLVPVCVVARLLACLQLQTRVVDSLAAVLHLQTCLLLVRAPACIAQVGGVQP